MQPTGEQCDAIHISDKNLLVVAGAGTGKTRVLIERFLQLLHDNREWRIYSIVAITFTREAAYEMRHRLREELERRLKLPDGDPWARHLAQLDRARIDTIHGLCADILRANAAQASVDPMFEVLDENEAAILLDDTVDDVLATLEAPLSSLFAEYDGFMIERALKQAGLINSQYPPPPTDADAVFQTWEQGWRDDVLRARHELLNGDEFREFETLPDVPGRDRLGALYEQYKRYLGDISGFDNAVSVVQLLEECYKNGAVGNIGSASAWGGAEAKARAAHCLRQLRLQIDAALQSVGEPPSTLDRATAGLLPLWHELVQLVRTKYRERKRARAQLDFDDLEQRTAQLLEDPAVQNRYRGVEFKHLLVDEFQDSNAAQWKIIRSLADLRRGGSLFLVGDPKQSIYQFRGADVSVFNRVRDQISTLETGCELPLSRSFRAHRPLVQQLNALFEKILRSDDSHNAPSFEVAFDQSMSANREKPPSMPAIELQLLAPPADDDPDDHALGGSGESQAPSADDMRRWEAYEIARHIKRLIEGKRPVYDKDEKLTRAIKYGDIAVLFQSTSKLTLYEDVFKAQGIPYLTVAGRGYYDRQEVWDMLDLLRFLHNAADSLSLATALRSPMFCFSDDLLFALRALAEDDGADAEPLPLWQALEAADERALPAIRTADRPLIQHARQTLNELRRLAGTVTISELIRRALTKTNYLAILTGLPDGARRRGNVEKLLQLADVSGRITLGKFSRYLADLSSREAREGEALLQTGDNLRLMTVHASKGLEFPMVILADASWERGAGGAPTLLADPETGLSCRVYNDETQEYVNGYAHRRALKLQAQKEAAERKRLLYVAATRAQDYLFISGSLKRKRQGNWTARGWLNMIVTALNLGEIQPGTGERGQLRRFACHDIRIITPSSPLSAGEIYRFAENDGSLWDSALGADDYPPLSPPLLQPLPPFEAPKPSHITVTQLVELGVYRHGSVEERDELGRRFQAGAFSGRAEADADSGEALGPPSPRTIGRIAHEILRYSNFDPASGASDEMIAAIAWEQGLTDAQALRWAADEARELLASFSESEVYRMIASARAADRPLYAELPFMFRLGERVVHGVLDVLLQRADGSWAIIDYKTSDVLDGSHSWHARRFHLQMGIYAAAVRQKFGLARLPQAYIHYIRGNQTVALSSQECQHELDRLDATIGQLMGSNAQA